MKRSFSISLLALLFSFSLYAQQKSLGHIMSPEEKAMMPAYLNNIQVKGITTPPQGNIRTMAEWEEVQAVTISWESYYSVLSQIVEHAQKECKVIINCSDSSSVKNYLQSQGVTPTNVLFNLTRANSVWIRDYGAQCIYRDFDDSLALIDWIYNRPRPRDDTIPESIARMLDLDIYNTAGTNSLTHTGGNFMTDGYGTGFSSHLVTNENSTLSSAQIDTIMKQFMGIDRYIKMNTLPYDGIHHIDMHMKLLDEETLLIGEYPSGIADGPQIEANLLYVLNNFSSTFGSYYKVIRMPMPGDNTYNFYYPNQGGDYLTYTNSLIINNSILVPTYYEKYDTTALRIYREAMPGYKVIGINSSSVIPASGAIHCITNTVGVEDQLLIKHKVIEGVITLKGALDVNAEISHRSGIQSARVGYRNDTNVAYIFLPMTFNTTNNVWTTTLPDPGPSQILEYYYYIEATANSGKVQTRPMPAPKGYWKFIHGAAGVNDNPNSIDIQPAFPNPSKGITCIPIHSLSADHLDMNLYDVHGRLIRNIFTGNAPAGKQNYFINTTDLSSGAYLIRASMGSSSKSQVLIVR